jgi:hypothetical protein
MPVKKEEIGILTKEDKAPTATEEIVKPKTSHEMNVSADIVQPS